VVTLEEAKSILGNDCPMSDSEVEAMLEELLFMAQYACDLLSEDVRDSSDPYETRQVS
jgi:hypothetical protein